MTDHIQFCYALNGPSKGMALHNDEIAATLKADDLAWVHLDANSAKTHGWMRENLPYLDRHAVDALLAEETRPRATPIGKGLLVILRGVNVNEGAVPEDMVSIRLWIDGNRIVSVRRRPVRAVQDIAEQIQAGKGPEDAGAFLAMLIERLTARVEPVLREIDDQMDKLEIDVIETGDADLRRPVTAIRQRTIILRRYLGPQREAVGAMRTADLDFVDDLIRRRLTESQDRLTRTIEDLDAIRDRAQVLKDELTNALADRMNRNMYTLSVIAAIFLPLGFFTGLLGVNVGGIPGADSPLGFLVLCLAMAVMVALQVYVFRRLRWF